jgi:hypothetical protein
MPIDYTLEFPCEPKRKLGLEGLSDRLRLLEDLHRELELTPEQTASVREVVFELRPLAFHCAKCPANHRSREFGCFGRVETPISEEAEDWLWDLLPSTLVPADLETAEDRTQAEAVSRLIDTFKALEITGKNADRRRPEAKTDFSTLFEGKKPVRRKYGKVFRRKILSTSALLEALLLRSTVSPALGEQICRALGIWQTGEIADDGVQEMYFTQPIEGDDDPTVAQLKLLFFALMTACSLDTNLLTEIHTKQAVTLPEPVGQ